MQELPDSCREDLTKETQLETKFLVFFHKIEFYYFMNQINF